MPKEIFPSSYVCDCGEECHFSENTVRQMKEMSRRKAQELIADDGKHRIVFEGGEWVAIWCPVAGKELSAKSKPRRRVTAGGKK